MRRAAIVLFLLASFTGLAAGSMLAATNRQTGASIALDPTIECWYHDEFPMLEAQIEPPERVAHSRLYFRCSSYPDYYFVDLALEASSFRGVGPQAEETCPRVHYYVETLSQDFDASRTPERVVDVSSYNECRGRHAGAAFFTGEPNLIVGGTTLGGNQMAPGFKLAGVQGFISAATGELTTVSGGGVSTGLLVGVGAAVGAGVVGVAVASGGSEAPSENIVAPLPPVATTTTTTSVPGSSPPPSSGVQACIESEPVDAVIEAGGSISLDARCSAGTNLTAFWDLGDGRTREGVLFIRPTYRDPGTYVVKLTVTQDGSFQNQGSGSTAEKIVTVREPEQATQACFTVTNQLDSQCFLAVDASCTQGPVRGYSWVLDVNNALGFGAQAGTGVTYSHSWPASSCVSVPPPILVTLEVDTPDGRVRAEQFVTLVFLTSPQAESQRVTSSFSSFLGVAPFDGQSHGYVKLNDARVDRTGNAAPYEHLYEGRFGENVVEAYTTTPLEGPAFWKFDFSKARYFVSGSIRVEGGHVLSVDARSVVVRLSGDAGERIRFKYQLRP